MKSILPNPSDSVGTAIAVMGLVYATYNTTLPSSAQTQATDAYDQNLEAGRRKAAYMSVALVSGIALLTGDWTIFSLGGMATIVLDWDARQSIATHPTTGQIVTWSGQPKTLAVDGS